MTTASTRPRGWRFWLALAMLLAFACARNETAPLPTLPPAPLGPPPPNEPPRAPNPPQTTLDAPSRAADAPDCAARYCLFLPVASYPHSADRQQAREMYREEFLAQPPAIEWSGDLAACRPGETGQAFRDAILRRINYFRLMAGVPALESFDAAYNRLDQAAALMMSANDALSHTPPKDWTCYSEDGYAGASSSNLALGANGLDAIDLYIRDPGGGNSALGHRRWILYPNSRATGTGDIPAAGGHSAANALRAWDDNIWGERPPTRYPFVAWPPPGYVPYPVVYARWSFSYPDANFDHATVSVYHEGKPVPLDKYTPDDGYGDNTLVWAMNNLTDYATWPRPGYDQTYVVEVKNVRIEGAPQTFTYFVYIFDPAY